MNILQWIREKTLSYLGGVKQDNTLPYDTSFLITSNNSQIAESRIKEYNIWYKGNSSELLDFFSNRLFTDYPKDPIYTRNKQNYFWSKSAQEDDIKRVHVDIPRVVIDTLVSAIGDPIISTDVKEKLDLILEDNDFYTLCSQIEMPKTLIDGWGAFRIDFDKDLRDTPIITYYDALNTDFIYRQNTLIGIVYKDYYKDKKDNEYILFDIRRREKNKSIIEKKLFRLSRNKVDSTMSSLTPVDLKTISVLKDTAEYIEIDNFNEILGVPCIYFKNTDNIGYGRSIFMGKCDLFDALDECASQSNTTVRRSTPIEYISDDALERDSFTGEPKLPKLYDRKFLQKPSQRDGDGNLENSAIQTTQPNLNISQYSAEEINIINLILTGILSPASIGIDVSKRDNADAQREKEKITLMTRNNIIRSQEKCIKKVLSLALCIQEYMNTGRITNKKYDISVRFNEFANPSLETQLQILSPALQAGVISPSKFVDLIWRDTISKEEKDYERKYIEDKQKEDSFSSMGGNFNNPDNFNGVNAELGKTLGGGDENTYAERTGFIDEPKEDLSEPIEETTK